MSVLYACDVICFTNNIEIDFYLILYFVEKFSFLVHCYKHIPSKADILAYLHRLKVLIEKKYTSNVEKMSIRYFYVFNKIICLHPKNLQNLEIDKISAEILQENHIKGG